MPFKSEKQRRYLWANEPEIARDWADTYGSRIEKDDGGIARLGYQRGQLVQPGVGRPGYGGPGGHEDSYEAGKSYERAKAAGRTRTTGGGGGAEQWQRDALKKFAKLPSTTSGPTILPKKKPK